MPVAQQGVSERASMSTSAAAASPAESMSAATNQQSTQQPTDQAVLQYLKQHGLGMAAAELTSYLEQQKKTAPHEPSTRAKLAAAEAEARNEKHLLTRATGGNYGYDRDSVWPVLSWCIPDTTEGSKKVGRGEAKSHVDALISLQLWILSLPEADPADGTVLLPYGNPLERAEKLLREDTDPADLLPAVVKTLAKPAIKSMNRTSSTYADLPPSSKPELFAVGFCLLVHTYCELLEWGMESTARALRDAFDPIFQPLYPTEYRDLRECASTEEMMRLSSHIGVHSEALNNRRNIVTQLAGLQATRDKLRTSQSSGAQQQELQKYEHNIRVYRERYTEMGKRATVAFERMANLPFLRRARAVRWQLTLSTSTHALLQRFLASEESLVAMAALLQTKCEVHVQQRMPLPFCPACVLDSSKTEEGDNEAAIDLHEVPITWGAPTINREASGEVPHPPKVLKESYDDAKEAQRDKSRVEYNRALLVNGFRRLQALERKREYESLSAESKKQLEEFPAEDIVYHAPSALEPSILMTTLGNDGAPKPPSQLRNNVASLWKDSGSSVHVTCASSCPPDGHRVAVGCDDAAIRVYHLSDDPETPSRSPNQVLLGHQNGFPVMDVSWNRDGRALLSAGGDGSIRLWDVAVAGSFGEKTSPPTRPSQPTSTKKPKVDSTSLMDVPGAHAEDYAQTSGAALSVYRGHVPGTPVWSVAFSPSGYYFCSTGADSTARLWTTDRPVPVRLLTGHTSKNVTCVTWHPNANYVLTGSEDRTVRLWDVQTGRTVRLLTGCNAGVSCVAISPGGRYAAGADCSGIVHLWDLSQGQKLTEFRSHMPEPRESLNAMIHTLSFSACGTALATGGDDCCVRIWDVQQVALATKSQEEPPRLISKPSHAFVTKRAMVLDLHYTKRNLLLSVGKLLDPIPLSG